MLLESFEYFSDMDAVVFFIFGEDEYVVKVYHDVDIKDVAEYVVHEVLEYSWGIGESKGHDLIFEEAITSPECCFPFIAFSNTDIGIADPEIDFGEMLGSPEAVDKVVDMWNGVRVLDSDFIEGTVVDTEAKSAIWFLDKKNGSTDRGCGVTNMAIGEVLLDIFL